MTMLRLSSMLFGFEELDSVVPVLYTKKTCNAPALISEMQILGGYAFFMQTPIDGYLHQHTCSYLSS